MRRTEHVDDERRVHSEDARGGVRTWVERNGVMIGGVLHNRTWSEADARRTAIAQWMRGRAWASYAESYAALGPEPREDAGPAADTRRCV